MDKSMKYFFAVIVGWLWTVLAGVMDQSLTTGFHYFSIYALDGLINFIQYVITLIGWLTVVLFGFLIIRDGWKEKKK